MKKICFVLPRFSDRPSGGYKMVFEYANRLCQRGHAVSIIFINKDVALSRFRSKLVQRIVCGILTRVCPRWFPLDKRIKKYSGLNNISDVVCHADVAVATAVGTADFVNDNFLCKKIYFIQGYEDWITTESELIRTYNLGMDCVTVSSWLKNVVESRIKTETIVRCISNPIDNKIFFVSAPIELRNKYCIGMLYHQQPTKGTKYAIEAIKQVRERYPMVEVEVFGTPARPELPEWFHYTRRASQTQLHDLYNKCSIFVCASIKEGFGLTGAEAMACGCALISSDFEAVRDYAIDGENSLLSDIKDVRAMVDNICRLISNDNLRIQLASNAQQYWKSNGWDSAVDRFENIIGGK